MKILNQSLNKENSLKIFIGSSSEYKKKSFFKTKRIKKINKIRKEKLTVNRIKFNNRKNNGLLKKQDQISKSNENCYQNKSKNIKFGMNLKEIKNNNTNSIYDIYNQRTLKTNNCKKK